MGEAMLQNPNDVAVAQAAQARGASDAQIQRDVAQQQRQAAQTQRDAAEQARDVARARQQTAEADQAAARASRSGDFGVITITKDGKTITLDGASPEVLQRLGIGTQQPQQSNDGPFVVATVGIVSAATIVLVALTLWYRSRTRRGGAGSAMPAELTQRMARMETAIESVAIEVERISEGQRFTTRVLSERAPAEVPRG